MTDQTTTLQSHIHRVRDLVQPTWNKGKKTTSIIMECNIDKAEAALASGDPRRIKRMNNIMEAYGKEVIA